MKTLSLTILFAVALSATPPSAPGSDHHQARRWMVEAQQTSNPFRLWILAGDIRDALNRALQKEPNNVQIRLDLVRFHTMTPRIAGGKLAIARKQAAEILRRNPPLGHFARGYIAYRQKEYGPARRELRLAARTASDAETKTLALRWLGWLSQETQQ